MTVGSRAHHDATNLWNIFDEGNLVGNATQIDLPGVPLKTVDVQGAGLSGTISKPISGIVDAMTATINFSNFTSQAVSLCRGGQRHLECWRSVQATEGGVITSKQYKIVMKVIFKNLNHGKVATGEPQDGNIEMAVEYLKIYIDGEDKLEIDPYNCKYVVDGVDELEQARANAGM